MKTSNVRTISRKQIISWGWTPSAGRVDYNMNIGKGQTKRGFYVGRIIYLWGMAEKGRFAEPWAGEDWIYIRRGNKHYRTLLHSEPVN